MPVVAADASDADELAAHMQEVKALLQSNPSIVPSVLQYAKRMVAKSKKNCVRKLSGQEVVTLHVKAKDTVKSVKDKVASVLKLDPRETKLTLACGATQLRDEKDTMHACRIQNDAVLTAILQNMPKEPRRPCWMERTVWPLLDATPGDPRRSSSRSLIRDFG